MSIETSVGTSNAKKIISFDWSLKASSPVDCSPRFAQPVVTVVFHLENGEVDVSEYTVNQVSSQFFAKCSPSVPSISIKMYSKLPRGYLLKSTAIIVSSGVLGYVGIELMTGSEKFYEKVMMPLVWRYTDGEDAHKWAVKACNWGFLPKFGWNRKEYPELECDVLGKHFKNPVGLAAGFDKNGEAILPLAKDSGFGLIEIGSVTPIPQPGNPRPRVFRLIEDEGIINRYGFNSDGVGRVQQRVKTAKAQWSDDLAVFGINLGKNKLTEDAKLDYEIGVTYFGPYCDYLVINISSPNTPGLRAMQKKADLEKLASYVKQSVEMLDVQEKPKVLLKIAPDLVKSEMADIAKVVVDRRYGIDGLIISNTTITRPLHLQSEEKGQTGGLSGKPVKEISNECVREMYRLTEGKVPIIGCGGISSGQDAYEKIRSGASLVQLYSSLAFKGFPVIGKVKRELVECLKRDGFTHISEAVGADHRK